MWRWIAPLLFCLITELSAAAEPSSTPQLHVDPGMHTAMIRRIATDAAGRFLATASDDKTARVWDRASGRLLKTLRPPADAGNEGKLAAVAMTPDGNTVAVGGWTGFDWEKQHSIYLFDRASGRLLRRLSGLPEVVLDLAFSPDGRTLAAGLGGKSGVRLFATETGRQTGEDRAIAGEVYGLHWHTTRGLTRLAATSLDGQIHLYTQQADGSLLPQATRRAPDGGRPLGIAFSPDGRRLAIGYADAPAVSLLDGATLVPLGAADTQGLHQYATLPSVAWRADGRALWAGGTLIRVIDVAGKFLLRRWPVDGSGGLGAPSDLPVADQTISSLAALPDGGIAFGSGEPRWGVLNADSAQGVGGPPPVRDFRGNRAGTLELSADARQLKIGTLNFDLARSRLSLPAGAPLAEARTSAPGVEVRDWLNLTTPRLNGSALALAPYERSRSIALAPDGRGLVLGTDWNLRRFDAAGRVVWVQPAPGAVWAVNLSADGQTVVAAYGDGTIRWHRDLDGAELYALYAHPDGKRWVLWTPSGLFDASDGAHEFIGWHVNQGKDKEARFVTGGQLYAKLYRPDLIARLVAGEDAASLPRIDVASLLATGDAPKLSLIAPVAGASAARDVTLRYRVCNAGGGIGKRVLRLNGMTVALAEGDRGVKPKRGTQQEDCHDEEKLISLQPGENTVAITAFNKAGEIESLPVELNLAFKSSVPGSSKPTLHVLALAVDHYRDGDLRLNYSKKDAQGLIDNLKLAGKSLYGEIRVHTLFDDTVRKAGIEQAFDKLSLQVKPEDVFVLYLAGHGVTDREDGNYYFLPVDFRYSDAAAVRKQAISNNFFQENLTKIRASKSLVLLDTCNSGSFQAVKTRGVEEKTAVARLVKATGRATLMASSSSQVALEGHEGHGVFTWALIQGLKGKAAQGKQITVGSLADYVGETLPELTYKKFGYEQVPQRELQGMNFPIGVR